jgi:GntR family transcriptional repressor for pyruvate dehydrogenase complex
VSRQAVIQIVEVRRALEAEVAALAAQRCTVDDVKRIRQSIAALETAVLAGGDGVDEDVRFHSAIAQTASNPFLISTLDYLGQFLKGATRVTRANESRRVDFARQVREEHDLILQAIESRDPVAARNAATGHMNNAIERIEQADPAFWQQAGEQLARPLVTLAYPIEGLPG